MMRRDARVRRAVAEDLEIVRYDPRWPDLFRAEADHLRQCLPAGLLGRIEHFGSTAVPGLAAKPVIDILVEVADLAAVRARVVPVLAARGYEYFWRPTAGDDVPPFYAWFIKRDPDTGRRTHHIHMVEPHYEQHWERLLFRDYLAAHPECAAEYQALKFHLAASFPNDRAAYTQGKTGFISRVMDLARRAPAGQ